MGEKEDLLDWFDRARAEMRAALQDLDPAQKTYPAWGIKENLVHITGWDEVTLKSLQTLKAGGAPYILPPKPIDAHNDDFVAARAELSFEEVLHEWEEVRARLIVEISKLSEGDLYKWIIFPWGPQGTLMDMLAIIAGHEEEHAAEQHL